MNDRASTEARPLVDGLHFGECPRWHAGRLWYVDFYAGSVRSVGEGGDDRVELEVPGEPAGLGWMPDGNLLVVSRKQRVVFRLEVDGKLVEHGDLKPIATFYGNDMVVDRDGRAYVGNFGFDLDRFIEERGPVALVTPPGPPTASLVRIEPDGSAHVAAEDLHFPNGMVITPEGRTLIVAETLASRLTAFDVGDDGELSGRREWATLSRCSPDGICLDAAGRVWVANARYPECILVAEGGDVVDRVSTSQPSFACMLGGADRSTLYVMTAPTGTESVVSMERSGRIEQAPVEVGGAGLP